MLKAHFKAVSGGSTPDVDVAEASESNLEGGEGGEANSASAPLQSASSAAAPACELTHIELVGLNLGKLAKVPASAYPNGIWYAVSGVYLQPTANASQREIYHVIRDHTVNTWDPATAKVVRYGLATRRASVSTTAVASVFE